MQFEATFELSVPHLDCEYAMQNNSFETEFKLEVSHLDCEFQLG